MARETNYACPVCGAAFSTREQLESHNREAHEHPGQQGADALSREQAARRDEPQPPEAREVF